MSNSAGAQSLVGISGFATNNYFELAGLGGKFQGGTDDFSYGALIVGSQEVAGAVETIMGNLDGANNGYDLLYAATPQFIGTTGNVAVTTDAPPDPLNVTHKAMFVVVTTTGGTTTVYMNGHNVASTGAVTLGNSVNSLRIGVNATPLLPAPTTYVCGVFFANDVLNAAEVALFTQGTQWRGTIPGIVGAGEGAAFIDYIWNARENISAVVQTAEAPKVNGIAGLAPDTIPAGATWSPSQFSFATDAQNGTFNFTAVGSAMFLLNFPNISWY